jgi:hypothetical protein
MIAAHADWSVDQAKRWVTIGRSHRGSWVLDAPQPVGEVAKLLVRLAAVRDEAVAFGIDCPIGLPRAYAGQLSGFKDFPTFLRGLHPQSSFFQVAEMLEDVSLARPFFPAGHAKGMGLKLALARRLGLPDTLAMARMADRQTANRPAAAHMFWTLGPNQCGKAALAAWRDLLLPAFETLQIKLWPFDGAFRELMAPGRVVVAETYPAEVLRQLGLRLAGSKQDVEARRAVGGGIFAVMERLSVRPSPELSVAIASGFGAKPSGEDPFDSLIGALGMITVLSGALPDVPPCPVDPWEGWMLGQTDLPVSAGLSQSE